MKTFRLRCTACRGHWLAGLLLAILLLAVLLTAGCAGDPAESSLLPGITVGPHLGYDGPPDTSRTIAFDEGIARPFVMPADLTVVGIGFFADLTAPATTKFDVGLYDAPGGGAANTRLAVVLGSSITPSFAAGPVEMFFPTPVPVMGGATYWGMVVDSGSSAVDIGVRNVGTPVPLCLLTGLSTAPATVNCPTGSDTQDPVIYLIVE